MMDNLNGVTTDNNTNTLNSGTGQNSGWNDFTTNNYAKQGLNAAAAFGNAYSTSRSANYMDTPTGVDESQYSDTLNKINSDADQTKATKDMINSIFGNIPVVGQIVQAAGGVNDMFTESFSGKTLGGDPNAESDVGLKNIKNRDLGEFSDTFNPFSNIGRGVTALSNGHVGDAALDTLGFTSIAKTFGYETAADKEKRGLRNKMIADKKMNDLLSLQNSANNAAYRSNKRQEDRINAMYGNYTMGGNEPVYAYGGDMPTYDDKIDVIENGGTHESNPLNGVPIGINNAKLEENEVRWGDYVFSDRLY